MIYLENKYFNLISAYANYFFWLLSLAKTKLICDWTMQSVVGWEGYFFFSINGHARLFKVSLNVFIGGWGVQYYSIQCMTNLTSLFAISNRKNCQKWRLIFTETAKIQITYWYVARGNSSTDYVIIDYITLSDRSRRDDHSYTNVHIYWVSLIGSRYIINNIQKGWYRWYLKY